jgi:aminopeptidase
MGGSKESVKNIKFTANLPTEEVFTTPLKTGVNGKVYSTKPLNYCGKLIKNFSLEFLNGKVVKYSAEENEEALKILLETDEGSSYLGEVALVPYSSPISASNVLYYETLFDENASCHLALGRCYPYAIKNGSNMTRTEIKNIGGNDSSVHVDFMFGTNDLNVIGTTYEGKKIQIFKNGEFII